MGFKQCGNNIVVKSSVGYTGGRHLQNNNGKNTGTKVNSRTVGAASCKGCCYIRQIRSWPGKP